MCKHNINVISGQQFFIFVLMQILSLSGGSAVGTSSFHRFPLLMLDEQADLVEKHRVDTLLYCPNPRALQHPFINQDTGETVRARCNRWGLSVLWAAQGRCVATTGQGERTDILLDLYCEY